MMMIVGVTHMARAVATGQHLLALCRVDNNQLQPTINMMLQRKQTGKLQKKKARCSVQKRAPCAQGWGFAHEKSSTEKRAPSSFPWFLAHVVPASQPAVKSRHRNDSKYIT